MNYMLRRANLRGRYKQAASSASSTGQEFKPDLLSLIPEEAFAVLKERFAELGIMEEDFDSVGTPEALSDPSRADGQQRQAMAHRPFQGGAEGLRGRRRGGAAGEVQRLPGRVAAAA